MKGYLAEASDIMTAWRSMLHMADQCYEQYELLSYKVQNIEKELETAVNGFER